MAAFGSLASVAVTQSSVLIAVELLSAGQASSIVMLGVVTLIREPCRENEVSVPMELTVVIDTMSEQEVGQSTAAPLVPLVVVTSRTLVSVRPENVAPLAESSASLLRSTPTIPVLVSR